MRLEALGHASFIVRSGTVSILFDPLLFGEHHEGLYDIYPPRTLDLGRFPAVDCLVISHAHADHLDPDSLAFFPRELPVIAANDPLVLGCLEGLGFVNVVVAQDLVAIAVGDLTVTPTPAAHGVREHGFIVDDGETKLWHMIDTFPEQATVAATLQEVGGIDLLIAPWQPLQDSTLSSGEPVRFPYEMYGQIISTIALIAPRMLIPGACGFHAVGPASFTNHLIFPVTRARFVHDIEQAVPELRERVIVVEAGDALVISPSISSSETGLLPYCKSNRSDYRWQDLAYRPFELGFPVQETRGESFSPDQCLEAIDCFFRESLVEEIAQRDKFFAWHHKWQVVRQYEIVFADDSRVFWTLDFRGETPQVTQEESPLALSHTICSASLLIGLIAGSISWDYAVLSCELRRHDHTYLASQEGLRRPQHVALIDPLAMLFATPQAAEHAMALQLERVHEEWDAAQAEQPILATAAPTSVVDAEAVMAQVLATLGDVKFSE